MNHRMPEVRITKRYLQRKFRLTYWVTTIFLIQASTVWILFDKLSDNCLDNLSLSLITTA